MQRLRGEDGSNPGSRSGEALEAHQKSLGALIVPETRDIYTHIYIYIHIYICMYKYIDTYTYIYIYM